MLFFSILYERVVSVIQRKKQAKRMAKMARSSIFQAKKKRSLLKMKTSAQLLIKARKATLKAIRAKFYPDYDNLPLSQKVKLDQIISIKYGQKIDKFAKKLSVKLKQKETERVKKAREKQSTDIQST
tara:strand:- start:5232 stop:5612 length:381 start_codon:yes stop_codon:yes gene_type:complete